MNRFDRPIRERLTEAFKATPEEEWLARVRKDLGDQDPRQALQTQVLPGIEVPGLVLGAKRETDSLPPKHTRVAAWIPLDSAIDARLEAAADAGAALANLHARSAEDLRHLATLDTDRLPIFLDARPPSGEDSDARPGGNVAVLSASSVHAARWAHDGADATSWLGWAFSRLHEEPEATRIIAPVSPSVFTSLAAIRALRLGAARIRGTEDIDIWAQVSPWHYSGLDPETNLVRAALAASTALLAGVDVLEIPPMDLNDPEPTIDAGRWALNIAHLGLEESYLGAVHDPGAGSAFIERLTDEIGEAAWAVFQALQSRGGTRSEKGKSWIAQRVEAESERQREGVKSGKAVMVGVNRYQAAHPTGSGPGAGRALAAEQASGETA